MAGEQRFGPSSTQQYVTKQDDDYEALLALLVVPNNGIQKIDVQLSDADIKTLRATAFQLVPAPGAGYALVPHRLYWLSDFVEGAYTLVGSPDLEIQLGTGYHTSYEVVLLEQSLGQAAIAGANDDLHTAIWSASLTNPPSDENQPLMLQSYAGAEYGWGNASNTLSLRIWYTIVPIVPFGGE